MAINKVVYGGATLVDLTSDSVTPETLLERTTAHNAAGERFVGEMPDNGAIKATIDGLTVTSYTIPAGYHNGSGSVSLTSDIQDAVDAAHEKVVEKGGTTEKPYLVTNLAAAIETIPTASASNLLFPPTTDWMATTIYTSNYTLGGYSFENNQFYGFITGGRVAAGMVTTSLKNLSGVNAITIEFEVTGSEYLDASGGQMVFYLRTSQTGSNILDKVVSQEELASGSVTIDVSSYNSSYYLLTGIAIWGSSGAASLTVKEVRYE